MKKIVGKAPAFQFYVRDWLSAPDLRMASPSTRGIWIDLLCFMWESSSRGQVEGAICEFEKLTGASPSEMQLFFDEAKRLGFCDIVTGGHNLITVINRRMSQAEKVRQSNRLRQQKCRSHKKVTPPVTEKSLSLSSSSTSLKEKEQKKSGVVTPDETAPAVSLSCPHKEIIKLYHEILPTLRKVVKWTETRAKMLKARWYENEEYQNLKWWEMFFKDVAASNFLTGKTKNPFYADLEWLIRPNNFVKVVEGKYKNQSGGDESPEASEARKKLLSHRKKIS